MEVREARAEEIPYLKARLAETQGEQIDLETARVFVVVDGGKILGMLPLRMVWQAEPLLVFSEIENTQARRRAALGLYRAMESWLGSAENKSGIRWAFAITRASAVAGWLGALGWLRQYAGAETYLKYFRERR